MPALTMAQQISLVKRLARADSAYLTETYDDDVARRYVMMGVDEFVKNAHGPSKEDFIDVTPTFNTRTTWAIRLTIVGGANALTATDIAITGTARAATTGTIAAGDLEDTIQAAGAATATVTWSTTAWMFTIDALDSTSITVEAPETITYVDATAMLFGKTGSETSTTWESDFPEDCTLVADLPSDFSQIEHVEWDKHQLYQAPFDMFMSPETNSTWVDYYAIRGKKIFLSPVPSERKLLKVRYRYFPATVTITGSSDTTECALDDEFHMAPVYYAAGMILTETFEHDEAQKMNQRFYDQVQRYRLKEANQNTKLFPRNVEFFIPKVEV